MIRNVFEIALGVIGLVLVLLGLYGILRDKFGQSTAGGALGATINLPLSAFILMLGLASGGFAAYLAVGQAAQNPTSAPTISANAFSSSPTADISVSPSPTSASVNSASASPTASLAACNGLVKAIRKEAGAIFSVNSNVEQTASGTPTKIMEPGYDQARANEIKANQAAQDALDNYPGVGLNPPSYTYNDILKILNEVSGLIGRLPNEIQANQVQAALSNWGAMQDRPNVLDEKVAPAISPQCAGL